MHRSQRNSLLPLLFFSLCLSACGGEQKANASGSGAETASTELATAQTSSKAMKPTVISKGEEVALAEHIADGQTTVFDFTSEYCGPCRQVSPYLDKLHAARADVQVVKVDINRPGQRGIDWQSPVAKQYGLSTIPHFKVFDGEGELLAEGRPAWDMVVGWINEVLESERQSAGSR